MKIDTKEFEGKMQKTVAAYESELETIRVGRANPNVLNKVRVDYWGTPSPLSQIGDVKVTDARTIQITPWESTLLRAVEKAIQESDIGINPINDGKCIRLAFPQLTEERRKEIQKQVAKMGEEAKVIIRNIRRDANEKCKLMKKNSEMTEDEQKTSEKSIQDKTDEYIKKIDAVTAKKDKEIISI